MRKTLAQTENAQVAIVTASAIIARYMSMMGVAPVVCGGHSLGELTALYQAGAYDFQTLIQLASLRGRAMASPSENAGAMAALFCSRDVAESLIASVDGYAVLANINSTKQVVVSGDPVAVNAIIDAASKRDISAARLNVSNAFHSRYVNQAAEILKAQAPVPATPKRLDIDVYSCMDGQTIDENRDLRGHLGQQVIESVDFVSMVNNLESQCDILMEVGPGNVLTKLVADILAGRSVTCLPSASRADVDCCMNHLLAKAFTSGVDVQWSRLFDNRMHRPFVPVDERIFIQNPCENELENLVMSSP